MLSLCTAFSTSTVAHRHGGGSFHFFSPWCTCCATQPMDGGVAVTLAHSGWAPAIGASRGVPVPVCTSHRRVAWCAGSCVHQPPAGGVPVGHQPPARRCPSGGDGAWLQPAVRCTEPNRTEPVVMSPAGRCSGPVVGGEGTCGFTSTNQWCRRRSVDAHAPSGWCRRRPPAVHLCSAMLWLLEGTGIGEEIDRKSVV